MSRSAAPPRWARWLLGRALPSDTRDELIADLDEVFFRLREMKGSGPARLWYWREAVMFSGRFGWERTQEWFSGGGSGLFQSGAWLDAKLGLRMLWRYPGLTLIGCLALTLGVGITVGVSSGMSSVIDPTLDLPDADRIVALHNVDLETTAPETRALHDFVFWREELGALEELGAFASVARNLDSNDGGVQPLSTAIVTASTFRVIDAQARLGRTLLDSDEVPGAPRVAVIGDDVWRSRFQSDPGIIGRVVRVDEQPTTIVGVMPPGFRYPIAYQMWEPFRFNPLDYDRLEGPSLVLIGRLRPDISMRSAQLELDALGELTAARFGETHARLRPQIMPYLRAFTRPGEIWGMHLTRVVLVFLLCLICANVGLLILARTLARSGEIAVRNAMGAGRGRIVSQLFVETLVLSGVAAGIGLIGAQWGLGFVEPMWPTRPFWIDVGVDAGDVLFAAMLAVLSAVVAGVAPGLRATGSGMHAQLQRTAGGVADARFGKGSKFLILTQLVISTCLMGGVVAFVDAAVRFQPAELGIPPEEYFLAQIRLDRETPTRERADAYAAEYAARFQAIQEEIERRLANEPGVLGVTFATRTPFMDHSARFVEVEGAPPKPGAGLPGYLVRSSQIATDFLDVFGVELLAGRGFSSVDLEASSETVGIVTEAFLREVLLDGDPLGRRVRYVERDGTRGEWFRIVGTVEDVWTIADPLYPPDPVVYHPLKPGATTAVHAVAHAPNAPESTAQRIREIALAVEPTLNVTGTANMQDFIDEGRAQFRVMTLSIALGASATLLLALAGIYAMVSFTVTQRTREIGVRTALGSPKWRLASALLSQVMLQVAVGAVIGALILTGIESIDDITFPNVPAVAGAAFIAGLLASAVPTARGLRVRPAEALRGDG